jgi:tRNA1(Val) A37 N6-methylase TrmN6
MQRENATDENAFVPSSPKENGAYYTPDAVVRSLLKWAIHSEDDRLLDPACGDGRFIANHPKSVGIEQDPRAAAAAMQREPGALVHEGDFFTWAANTPERFECAAGNPPFIRYQSFKGEVRARALELCARLGADFTGLTSSWAPFLVATASLLKPGGRMAFVVPAEIGHAPYSAPLLSYLVDKFAAVQIIAIHEKLFPELSEDCWLLYAEGFGSKTAEISLTIDKRFRYSATPPRAHVAVPVTDWRTIWNRRLRPFLMPRVTRDLYRTLALREDSRRFGNIASIGIGYVTGDNGFFHLRPSAAARWAIPDAFLHPTVRNGRALPRARVNAALVEKWRRNDAPSFLLRIAKNDELPRGIARYLETNEGKTARNAYKCRVRDPWYSVPDVQVPDFFLSYMSGRQPNLVYNAAGCTCTNSVHSVRLKMPVGVADFLKLWHSSIVRLSCEIEGHPLGGGMLKLEPREATQVLLPAPTALAQIDRTAVAEGISTMRSWRHYADA